MGVSAAEIWMIAFLLTGVLFQCMYSKISVIFQSSHVKIRCSLSDFGIDIESKACQGLAVALWRSFTWQSQNLSQCWDLLGPEGSSTFSCTQCRFSVTMIEWTYTHTHMTCMLQAVATFVRGPFCCVNLFNAAVETKIRPYPASLPAGEETVPKLQETSSVYGFQQCHLSFFSPYYQLSDMIWDVSKTTQGTRFRKLRAGWSRFGRRSGRLSHLDSVGTCSFEVFLLYNNFHC